MIILTPNSGPAVHRTNTIPEPICCDIEYRTDYIYRPYTPGGLEAAPTIWNIDLELTQQAVSIEDHYSGESIAWGLQNGQQNLQRQNIELASMFMALPFPKGFASWGSLRQFGTQLQAGLSKLGFKNTKLFMQGSAASGRSYLTKEAFDVGRKSDFDIALVGDDIYKAAEKLGLTKGGRTGPIEVGTEAAQDLGLNKLLKEVSEKYGRKVNVMIFETVDAVKEKAASIRIPTSKDGF